ncbi:methylmalonyl-CoA epimerase [bacterium]|nr:methylmalonyl-CoA epimerase [bacterium]
MIEKVQHIGIAVKNLDGAIERYTKVFGLEVIQREVIESRGIELAILDGKNILIELVGDYTGKSTIKTFLEKRGEGIHHIAFKVKDVQKELDILKKSGVELIDKTPREGAHSTKVAFIQPSSFGGVLIELCEDCSLNINIR